MVGAGAAVGAFYMALKDSVDEADKLISKPAPVDENWMRVAPGTDAAIWRPWSRETGEL
jgi:hypothetical protein